MLIVRRRESAETVEVVLDIPVTRELLITQFIHRWGYNATAQEAMRPELEALIAFVRLEARREV